MMNSAAIWPLSYLPRATSSISYKPRCTTPRPWGHAPLAAERPAGTNEAAGMCGSGQKACAHDRKTAAGSGRSYPGCCSPQLPPHTAPQPAHLRPVRSQVTPSTTASSLARNLGASVLPGPTSQLASLWCADAVNRHLVFRPGTRMGAVRGLKTPRPKMRLTSRTSGRP